VGKVRFRLQSEISITHQTFAHFLSKKVFKKINNKRKGSVLLTMF
jgi:hypothetical protein